ncbi:MAG: Ppx/GppA family phosphatase [Polyangiaceae bacterium]|nr:Ppx/GppA family phosphatase [Polyangiaceae bacterium]
MTNTKRHPGSSAGERRVATIDIGTNSVLLLVARLDAGGVLQPIEERATITRLGEGVDRTRTLAPAAIERTLACLEEYARAIAEHGVTDVAAVGTSAMRDASGGDDLRRRARTILGVEPQTISGDEEARLTFRGGLSGLALPPGRVVVFDIGGGSTEFISGDAETRAQSSGISLDVGSVRLTERHVKADPPSPEELSAIGDDIERELAKVPSMKGATLVGVAGTVTTIAAIARSVDPYDASKIHGAVLSKRDVGETAALLARTKLAERQGLPGLSPKRADVIVAGAALCAAIVRRADASELVVSDRGVRWGLAEELAHR